MIARNPTHRPTAAGHAKWSCCGAPVHDYSFHKCAGKPAAPASKRAPKVRAGALHEARLCAVLDALGYIDINNATRTTQVGMVYVREYAWGAYLSPPRGYRFDVAIPAARRAIEVEGGCHGVQKMRRHDVERMQLAQADGWIVTRVLPEQLASAGAADVVRAALGFVDRPATGKEVGRE